MTVGREDDGRPDGIEVVGLKDNVGNIELGILVGDDDVGLNVVNVGEDDVGTDL